LNVPKLEKALGIEVYASTAIGVGGKIRQFPEDFTVEEVLTDCSRAQISPAKSVSVSGRGRYLLCVLVKRNWDTFLAVKAVAKKLGVSSERIRIAGIKDAKAVTAQHFSIYGILPEHVSNVKIKDITVYPLRFSNEKIHSNLLLGNHFRIQIRAIAHSPSTIGERLKKVQGQLQSVGGLPNFFGHQRFGTVRPITHIVGRCLVRGELEEAALCFLAQYSEHEHPESREARQRLLRTQNFREALSIFPRKLQHERVMLVHLAKRRRDFAGAFRRLPLKLRQLFVQAYQSHLFNRFLSRRMRQGISLNEPQTGDYVVNLYNNGLPTADFTQVTSNSLEDIKQASNKGEVRIALPIIGFKQPTSSGVQGEIEREILETENVAPSDFHVGHMSEIGAPGRLRTALTPIANFFIEGPIKDQAYPSKRTASLNFTLQKGSYATVLLREFMKPRDPIKAGF